MGQEQAARTRRRVRRERLVGAQVAAGLAVGVAVLERRLADEQVDILRIDPGLERKQVERLQAFKARRDSAVVERRLAELAEAASVEGRNLMPVIVDAVRDGVTLGEICDTWRQVWGTWREQPVF